MGSIIGKAMDDNMKKQQLFMLENQRVLLERQIQMQDQMRERMTAMQISRARELLYWYGAFYAIALTGLVQGYRTSKKPALIAPLVPLTFVIMYQADMAYGSKLVRIRSEAENILLDERHLLSLPSGTPTFHAIDEARKKMLHESKTTHELFL